MNTKEDALKSAWINFKKSGKVSDYLEFTALKNSKIKDGESYAEHNTGTHNKIPQYR